MQAADLSAATVVSLRPRVVALLMASRAANDLPGGRAERGTLDPCVEMWIRNPAAALQPFQGRDECDQAQASHQVLRALIAGDLLAPSRCITLLVDPTSGPPSMPPPGTPLVTLATAYAYNMAVEGLLREQWGPAPLPIVQAVAEVALQSLDRNPHARPTAAQVGWD